MFEREPDRTRAKLYQSNVLGWISTQNLQAEIEPPELEILEAEIGSLNTQQINANNWHYESAGVLAWALGRMNLPTVFDFVNPADVGDFWLDGLEEDNRVELRDIGTFQAYEGLMYNLHWRVRNFDRHHRPYDMQHMLADTPVIPGVPPLTYIKSDISAGTCALFESSRELAGKIHCIVGTRRHAASWLIGDAELFSEVGLDT